MSFVLDRINYVAVNDINLCLRIGFGVFDVVIFSPDDLKSERKQTDIDKTENNGKERRSEYQ